MAALIGPRSTEMAAKTRAKEHTTEAIGLEDDLNRVQMEMRFKILVNHSS